MAVSTTNLLLIATCILLALPSVIVTTIFYVMDQHDAPPFYGPESDWTCYHNLEFGLSNVDKLVMKVTTVMGLMGIILAASVERYVGICGPFQNRPGIWLYLILVLGLSVALNIRWYLETNLDLTENALAHDARYSQFVAYWEQIMVLGLIPLAALVILNGRIYATLKTSERFKQNITGDATDGSHYNSARLLFGVVLVFLICSSFRIASYVMYEIFSASKKRIECCREKSMLPAPVAFYIFNDLRNLFVTLNSCKNFVLSCLVGRKLRGQFFSLFKKLHQCNVDEECEHLSHQLSNHCANKL